MHVYTLVNDRDVGKPAKDFSHQLLHMLTVAVFDGSNECVVARSVAKRHTQSDPVHLHTPQVYGVPEMWRKLQALLQI